MIDLLIWCSEHIYKPSFLHSLTLCTTEFIVHIRTLINSADLLSVCRLSSLYKHEDVLQENTCFSSAWIIRTRLLSPAAALEEEHIDLYVFINRVELNQSKGPNAWSDSSEYECKISDCCSAQWPSDAPETSGLDLNLPLGINKGT